MRTTFSRNIGKPNNGTKIAARKRNAINVNPFTYIYMINKSPDMINTLHYKIAGLWYLQTLIHDISCACYSDISSIMSDYCRVYLTIKVE